MPQVPANFQVIDNHLNLGIDESRLVRSHVTALRFRLSPSTSSDSVALSRITRKRRKKPTIYELQLRSPDPSASHVCVDADTVLRVNTVDPFETLAIPYEPRLDPILHHWWTYFAPPYTVVQHTLTHPPEMHKWTRLALKRDWWPIVRSDTALCYATLLVAAGHLTRIRASGATAIITAHLKGQVLAAVRSAVWRDGKQAGTGLVAAMLTLAAYELYYGVKPEYHVHMKAAARLVQECGGLEACCSGALLEIATNVGHDVALYAGTAPYWTPRSVSTPPQRASTSQCLAQIASVELPPALVFYSRVRSLTTHTLDTMRLAEAYTLYRSTDRDFAIEALREIGTRVGGALSRQYWSPFQSIHDDACPVVAGLCSRLGCKGFASYALEQEGFTPTAADWKSSKAYLDVVFSIDFGAIRGTYYAPLAFWALFMTRLAVGSLPAGDIDILRCYAMTLKIETWSDVKAVLLQCVYVGEVFDIGCKAIWSQVETAPRTPLPSRMLDLPRTRFDADLAPRFDDNATSK